MNFEKMFESAMIGKMRVKNRLVAAPMVSLYMNSDGSTTERFLEYYESKARGGYGTIVVENYPVIPKTGAYGTMGGIWNEALMRDHAQLAGRIKKYDSKAILQLYHAGRVAPSETNGKKPVAPSPIADPTMSETPAELNREEIREIIEAFGISAANAQKAGFDGVEVHGAHGYLLGQFMSQFSNKRTDEYGGNYENRFRIVREIIEEIKTRTGDDFTIFFRVSAEDLVEGGQTIEDTKVFCMMAEEIGVHCIDISVAVYASGLNVFAPYSKKFAWLQDYSEEIKRVVSIPTVIVNRFTEPHTIEMVLREGKADFVAMARGTLADPDFPNKVKEGRYEDVIHCIGCMQGCAGRNGKGLHLECLVNPIIGNAPEYIPVKDTVVKNVTVVGGGPAGMQAAIVAAKRGHQVKLYESGDRLGGQWNLAAVAPGKEQYNSLTIWQKTQLNKLGVHIILNTKYDPEMLDVDKSDGIIIATGSKHVMPEIKGIDLPHVCKTDDILSGRIYPSGKCLVAGGGNIGAETAEHLAVHGKDVTLTTRQKEFMRDMEAGPKQAVLESLHKHGANLLTGMEMLEIQDGKVIFKKEGELVEISADLVVIAGPLLPNNDLIAEVKGRVDNFIVVGDAYSVQTAMEAMKSGHKAGLEI
jgi:2,4-dienoyl-CoA reductase-like NADH-dependent reductase (Old Yellow Enzyme family)/thioredoxin reductase